jgi:predicted nuclease of predicted toxin-antitoxin system
MKFLFDQDVPDDLRYPLHSLGHEVTLLRDVLPISCTDEEVLHFSTSNKLVLITCNRDDFLSLAHEYEHTGIIISVRRKTRIAERSALIRLIDQAGELGIINNINFA